MTDGFVQLFFVKIKMGVVHLDVLCTLKCLGLGGI